MKNRRERERWRRREWEEVRGVTDSRRGGGGEDEEEVGGGECRMEVSHSRTEGGGREREKAEEEREVNHVPGMQIWVFPLSSPLLFGRKQKRKRREREREKVDSRVGLISITLMLVHHP